MPCGSPDQSGRGCIILRSATRLTELLRLTHPGSEDYRNLLHMLQTEKPVFWDGEVGWLRTRIRKGMTPSRWGNRKVTIDPAS